MKHEPFDQRGPVCPICGKPPTDKYHPFCTLRCANIDLNRWLGEQYVIPVKETEEDWSEEG